MNARIQTPVLCCFLAPVGVLIAACNEDAGECSLREDPGGGVGGGMILPPGTGGFGEAPPEPGAEPQDAADEPIECKNPEVRCTTPASDLCVDQCNAIKAYCVHHAVHPYKSTTANGDLYWCTGGWPSHTCSYVYPNGDYCTKLTPGKWWCCYKGGKCDDLF
ncbi:MAG: hypothetical protein R3F14_10850 [Polyangiaceae bacterium]